MTGAVRIRCAESRDFEAVTALLEELGRPRVGESERAPCRAVYEAQLGDPDAAHLVAVDEQGGVVGFCSLHFRTRLNQVSSEAWMPDLIVTERARRAGAGSAMLAEADRLAAERGCHYLTLESGLQREDAHRLYRRFFGRDEGGYTFHKRPG